MSGKEPSGPPLLSNSGSIIWRLVLRRILRFLALAILTFYGWVVCSLVALRWVNPPTTAVQIERRWQAAMARKPYQKSETFVPFADIAPGLRHAVVAAEDARFYQHHGFDWKQVQIAVEDDLEKGRSRGASTITQQLVKNLFLTTSRSFIRKGVEFTIVPIMELVLSKDRILELYLNVIEWGPGVFGAQAAAEHYYRTSARQLTRAQALALASIIPNPIRRKPGKWPEYEASIETRMKQMGW